MTLPVRGWNPQTRNAIVDTIHLAQRNLDAASRKGEPRDVGTFRNLILQMRRRLTRFGYWPIDRRGATSRWTTFLNANTRSRIVDCMSVTQQSRFSFYFLFNTSLHLFVLTLSKFRVKYVGVGSLFI